LAEKIKAYWEKAKEVLGKVSKKIWITVAAVLVILIGVIAFVVSSNNEYVVLFSDLNSSDVSTIVSYLETNGITDYRLENGDTVLVPKAQEPYLKMRLVAQDYGTSGFAYNYYTENVGMLSTESERNRAWLISLEEKLRACIITMDGVKDAQVNLTPGEDNTYVLDSGNKVGASASVLVTMRDGKVLTDDQAAAIRALVSKRISGLTVEYVEILDSMGNLYTADDDTQMSSDSSALKLQLEEKYNNLTRTNVMQVLVPLFGAENVKVGVSCTVDVNRTTQADTAINLPEWATDGEGIIGSKIYDNYIVRNEGENAGGNVGTTSNSDLPTYVENETQPNGSEAEIGASGQVDYDNPRTETFTERTAGYLTDCMVSVSINSTMAGAVDTENLKLHVARAAGISDEYAASKISIYTGPFYVAPVEPEPEWPLPIPEWALYAGLGGLLLFMLILILILSGNKKRRKKKEAALAAQQQMDLERMLAAVPQEEPMGADVMRLKSEKSMELRKDIRKFADESPEIAAQIVKSLLRGGDNDG